MSAHLCYLIIIQVQVLQTSVIPKSRAEMIGSLILQEVVVQVQMSQRGLLVGEQAHGQEASTLTCQLIIL